VYLLMIQSYEKKVRYASFLADFFTILKLIINFACKETL
jgi:hypothetical protein